MLDLNKLQEIMACGGQVVEVHGTQFHKNLNGTTLIPVPPAMSVPLFSLTQAVSFIKAHVMDKKSPIHVNVDSHHQVTIFERELQKDGKLRVLGQSDFSKAHEKFKFAEEIGQEEFVIDLMTKFEKTEERDELLDATSKVKAERMQSSEDDGVGQTVASSSGAHLVNYKPLKKFWILKPHVSFPEIEQPDVPFLLRLHQNRDELPDFSLRPVDGGKWKIVTTQRVREWMANQLKPELGEAFGSTVVLL